MAAPIACQFSLERLLNQFFTAELASGALDFMHHKWLAIQVRDLGFQFAVSLTTDSLVTNSLATHSLVTNSLTTDSLATHSLVTHGSKPKLKVRQHGPTPDVALAGNIEDLLLLMTQQVDPDTLFFRRRLILTGDTELGLELKNFLDTIELRYHRAAQLLAPSPAYLVIDDGRGTATATFGHPQQTLNG